MVEIRPDRARVVVVPHGELDLATVGRLASRIDELVEAGFDDLVLDLRSLTFMDSSGLHMVLDYARRRDMACRVIEGGRPISRLFDVAGVRPALTLARR